jgi:translation initiation factor 1
MSKNQRIPTDGSQSFGYNPFDALSSEGLPTAPEIPTTEARLPTPPKPAKHRGRVDILRVKAGRGGKTVTVVKNFVGIGLPEKEQLAKAMQKACGSGGTVKDGVVEIQGEHRDRLVGELEKRGYRVKRVGG